MAVVIVAGASGMGLSNLLGVEKGWHPASLAVLLLGLILAVRLYWRLSGRGMPARALPTLGRIAKTHGWNHVDSGSLPARGEPFTFGGDHEVLTRYSGTYRGRSVATLNYRVRASAVMESAPFDYTIVAVFTDADSPVTRATPRLWGGAFRAFRSRKREIALESTEFGRKWRIVGRDAKGAHEIFQPTVMARMLEDDAARLTLAWDANAVMSISNGQEKSVDEIQRQLDVLLDIADRMPAYQTLSGAIGDRQTTGALLHSNRSGVEVGRLERILLIVAALAGGGGWLVGKLRHTVPSLAPLAWILIACALAAVLAYGVIRWRRTSRRYMAWSDRQNQNRRV